jgi:1-deoxy-D-xylulose-5-phosphate synthase
LTKTNPYLLLSSIKSPNDLKQFSEAELVQLCEELRQFLIETILEHGGHFSANLGVVELTVALHYVFDLPIDKLIWDVGHQAYGHKVLTGRMSEIQNIRKWGGISGFPKITESEYDAFGTGHSSTSISAALGMAEAALLNNITNQNIAVIGDGSLTAGQAFEALNNAGVSKANLLVIINDNNMGIDPNLGALSRHLLELQTGKAENNIFKSFGLNYFGPIDGHNVLELIAVLKSQKEMNLPRVLHLKTVKGKGYLPAEKEQTKWHAAASFVKLGEQESEMQEGEKYQDVFGETLTELAGVNGDVIGITPAMPTGCGMIGMMQKYPDRVFDVGIAEQHAVTFSAGLAAAGKRPFCNIYSSFLQRAYDQVIHDVCLQKLPVIFCLDRAGVVGEDGATHHGLYDLSFLKCLPNLIIAAPRNEIELRQMLFTALHTSEGPFAIRYPRGKGVVKEWKKPFDKIDIGKAEIIQKGKQIALIGIGHLVNELIQAAEILKKEGIICTIVDARFLAPLDIVALKEVLSNHEFIITLEDGCKSGGFGESIIELNQNLKLKNKIVNRAFPNEVIGQGTREQLIAHYGLNAESVVKLIKQYLLPSSELQ